MASRSNLFIVSTKNFTINGSDYKLGLISLITPNASSSLLLLTSEYAFSVNQKGCLGLSFSSKYVLMIVVTYLLHSDNKSNAIQVVISIP